VHLIKNKDKQNYRPGFSNTPSPQQQRTAQYNAAEQARQARNRQGGGNIEQQMQQGLQAASSAGINPMRMMSGGSTNPSPMYMPTRQVGYSMNV
jgi:hypothetical protein